jgi:hypothetical protein
MGNFQRDYAFSSLVKNTEYVENPATFLGIVRADGRVATRNFIGILTSVNCSATVARMIARHFENNLSQYPNVDGVVALTHKTGCGMASEGEGMDVLRRTMAGYARHPNFFATQVIGLGCEANQINNLLSTQGLKRHDRLHAFTIQEKGGTMKAVREGIARIEAILPEANRVQRTPVPASHLTLGLQCGGSDGYSGISANPALGAAVDLLVRHGGTAILSETPENYGAERPGRGRREHDLLHHRPRLGLRLQACALAQARHQHAALRAPGGGHGLQLRHDHRRHRDHRAGGRAILPADPRDRVGEKVQERGIRLRRRRVRAVDHRRHDVIPDVTSQL